MKAVCHQSVSNGNTVTVDHFAAGSSCPFALKEGGKRSRVEWGKEQSEQLRVWETWQERKRALAES